MSIKDPYDFIEWKPVRNYGIVQAVEGNVAKGWERRYIDKMRRKWVDYTYDTILLCTQAAAIAIFLSLLFN